MRLLQQRKQAKQEQKYLDTFIPKWVKDITKGNK